MRLVVSSAQKHTVTLCAAQTQLHILQHNNHYGQSLLTVTLTPSTNTVRTERTVLQPLALTLTNALQMITFMRSFGFGYKLKLRPTSQNVWTFRHFAFDRCQQQSLRANFVAVSIRAVIAKGAENCVDSSTWWCNLLSALFINLRHC